MKRSEDYRNRKLTVHPLHEIIKRQYAGKRKIVYSLFY